MIDLSFLTEAEQEAILKVLNRDTELKKAEEQRISQLQGEINDENELKYKSGQWFYEAKSRRHRDKIHGADLVRASIRKRKKPATIAELSQSSKDKSQRRWVNSINQDIFIPPELYGVMESPDETEEDLMPSMAESNQSAKKVNMLTPDTDKAILKNGTASPAKQRKNPFNSEGLVDETNLRNEMKKPSPGQVNGQEGMRNDIMSSIIKYGVKLPYPSPIGGRQTSQDAGDDRLPKQPPVPKPRKLVNGQTTNRSNSSLQREDSINSPSKRRGILKRRSSSSSTDSESIRFPHNVEPIKLVLPASPILEVGQTHLFEDQLTSSENSPDRQKQVRFSEKVLQKPPTPIPEFNHPMEVGEFGILDPNSYQNDLDFGFTDHPHYEESKPTQYVDFGADRDNSTEVLGQSTLEKNPHISLTIQTPSNSAPILEHEKKLEDSSQGINENRVYEILDESYPAKSIDSAGTEPLYGVVKKPSKSTSSDQEKDFDMGDAPMEPRFLGQRGKIENTYQSEIPLEFGKSYGGYGKINYGSSSTICQPGEVYVSSNEDILDPDRATNMQSSYHGFEDEPKLVTHDSDNAPKWKSLFTSEHEDSLAQPRTVQRFPNVHFGDNTDTFVKPYPENRTRSKYSPGEYNVDTKYNSMFLKNSPVEKGRLVAPSTNFPVAQNMPFSSRPVSGNFQTQETFLLENKERKDLPKSANFKVMPLKDRIHDIPREQMSNPSQFRSLKHFWNVEDKNWSKADVETSPNRILADALNRNKPTRADLKQRNSKEFAAEDHSLPSSFDSLSEEEQTSQRVASWLAQTPTVYGAEQVDAKEDQVHPGDEVMEFVDKRLVDKNNQAEDFSSALQKLTKEALEAPKITNTEHLKSEVIPISKDPDFLDQKKMTTAILMNSSEKKRPATGFYERVAQMSSKPSPAKETADMPAISLERYSREAVEENVERTAAPAKNANEFKIGFQKLMEEYESLPTKSDDEPQVVEPNLSSEDPPLTEMKEIIEKSSAPKGNEHQEFISALNKLEIEASTPPVHEDPNDQPEKGSTLNTVSPVKTSFKIGFEHLIPTEDDAFETPQERNVSYTVQSYPPYNEVVEKTTVPSRKEDNDLSAALKKLEHEAAINEPSAEQEEIYEKPKVTPTLQSTRSISTVQNFEMPSYDLQNMPSPSHSVETKSDLEDTYSNGTRKSSAEAEDTYVTKEIFKRDQPKYTFDGQGKLPVEEETVKRTMIDTEESSADYQNRLSRLEEEAAATDSEEPEDLSVGDTFHVSQAPTKEVLISKQVFSSNESIPTKLPSSRGSPKDLSQPQPNTYKELQNYSQSPSDQSGSFTGSAGNVLYKKPDPSGVSNSKQGKPALAGSPNDSNSSKHDKCSFEGMTAQDESISKVLDWFSRSPDSVDDQLPSVGLLEKSKTSPQQIMTRADKTERESSGPGVDDNLVNGNEASQKIKSISDYETPRMVSESAFSQKAMKNVDPDQPKIVNITPFGNDSFLEFGKSGSGCGKIQGKNINDEFVQKHPQLPVDDLFEEDQESLEAEKEHSVLTEKMASLDEDDTGETPIGKKKTQTEVLTPTLEQSEDHSSKKPEMDKSIIPQNKVSDTKLLWEGDRSAQDAAKKSVLSNSKRPFSPVGLTASPKSSSFDAADQNNSGLVTFKKVIVEEEDDPMYPVDQLKSFWENEKNKDTTKGRPDRPPMTNDIWDGGKAAPIADPGPQFKKRHTIHNFFDKEKSSDLEKNLPERSVSLSDSANESLKVRMKSTSFQNLKKFWSIPNKSDDKRTNQVNPENMTKQFGSNPDIRSKEPLISRVKSRLAAKSLQDIREDTSAISKFPAYEAEPMSRKFSKENSSKQDTQNSVNEIKTEINPINASNENNNLEEQLNSVDVMLQESSIPSNYLKSSVSHECDPKQSPGVSDEKQMEVTEVIEKSVAPERDLKSEISLKLKTLLGKSVNLPDESPQSATFENCPDDQNAYLDEENGEMNEKGRKMLLIKQSGFDAGSPVSGGLQENEKLSGNDYSTGKDQVVDSGEVVTENIEKTIIPHEKDPSDFDKKLQNLYNESLNTVNSQNGNLSEHEYMDLNEPDQNFSKVLAVSSGNLGRNIQSSGADQVYQPIIVNVLSKKTEIGNEDMSEPQQKSPTEIRLIRRTHSADGPAVLGDLEQDVDMTSSTKVTNGISEEPKLDASLAREAELNEFSSTPNDYTDNAPQLSKKEIIEKIEMPVVLPRMRFNSFDEKLKQLYEESQSPQPELDEATDRDNVAENNEQVVLKTKPDDLYSMVPKKTFLKSSTVNLESSQTVSADRETLTNESSGSQAPDVLVQEVNETIEKTVAPTRVSNAKSLEKLQEEALHEEEGGFIGNVSSGHVVLNVSHSKLSDQALGENSVSERFPKEEEDPVQEGTESAICEKHQEGTLETSVTFMSDRQSTPVENQNGSLRRSTLELYLETPYRREISKSIDFGSSGYIPSDVNKCMDESNPILSALKRSAAKTLNAKAVQEVSPTSTNQSKLNNQKEDTLAPLENSFPENAEKYKRMSQSVPTFLQDDTDGRETDSASESSFQIGRHKKSPSSLTNLSGSSGMASMSSVSGSVMSVYSGDFGNVDIKGSIEFSMDYVEQLKEFLIYVYQCKDLAAAEVKKQRSDPYVKAYLLPEKAKMGKRKTAVKKKTLNPVYNEILRYKIPKQSLETQTLNLSVWHHDVLGRNSFLGEVKMNLGMWDWNNTQKTWYQLEARTPASGIGLENRGEMKLSMKYIPVSPSEVGKKPITTGEVHIWIKECIQLPMLRENKINSFVKCTILPDTSRKSRQKTRAVDKTPNPIFNHTMVYDGFKAEDLREACVELTVWDHNKLSNHFLGGIRIGHGTGKSYGTAVDWMDSSLEESIMWEKMIASPNTWIEELLPLRMFKMAKLLK